MTEPKVSREIAEGDFVSWCELNDIDLEPINDEDGTEVQQYRRLFIRRVQNGSLSVEDDGSLNLTLSIGADEKTFSLKAPGADVITSRMKNDDDIVATRRMLGAWTGQHASFFTKPELRAKDYSFMSKTLIFMISE